MRILVANDDGIDAIGLKYLVEFAKTLGDVCVVAPKYEQSAKSQSINVRSGFEVKKTTYLGVDAYVIDSTPSDCVRFAIYYLKDNFDIVFSGLNRGYNSGEDILYSGTVAAASEGAMIGRRAIAFSTSYKSFDGAKYLKDAYDYIINNNLFEKHNFWNVNIPPVAKGVRVTHQGLTNFDTYFEEKEGLFYQLGSPHFYLDKDETSDTKAIDDGYISITPLTNDRTMYFNK